MRFPDKIQNLIEDFSKLPGIGRKTAERLVFSLLKKQQNDLELFAQHLKELQSLKLCTECFNFSDNGLCPICNNSNRDRTQLCIVAEQHDLNVIEETHEYHGLYHVLGGVLNPLEDFTENDLNIKTLIPKIEKNNILEVILALNPDMQGEATIIFLKKHLSPNKIKITRLARGLPMGSDLEYADEVTLSNALSNRREV
ncbi:recombination protein RecR [Candidatus Falkowbacteria bacterium RIFOXYD2_FULL_35_9]|uniref:Recombination protein RecR n=1 Tax=Candidatus Falkowbacteria bacterium RIFOXYC2_FULL_36_12 TaxID=1798002 RepID=A0A1F5SZX7_9BACT|nr:MAG: recombination protein RecR [Candidatus Falkowbacteria bacterium RIFOXYC2_FULL_36_12]OGF47646.1 MAG: recombination protein RecR [Candidatus Falkowbacteria bacterium RIFOXYD2_FULL_35_9]